MTAVYPVNTIPLLRHGKPPDRRVIPNPVFPEPRFSAQSAFKTLKWPGLILTLLTAVVTYKFVPPPKQSDVVTPQKDFNPDYIPGKQLGYDDFAAWTKAINQEAYDKKLECIEISQREFNKLLQKEFLPALKIILDPNNTQVEVVLGSDYSNPNWEEFTMDGGRGMPIIYRYRLNISGDPDKPDIRKMALITFRQYNPKTKLFEVVNAEDEIVNDAFRILVETEPSTSGHNRGFIGASFQATVKNGVIVAFRPITYYTPKGEPAPANLKGKLMSDELRPQHCIQCHGREDRQFYRTIRELERHSKHGDMDTLTKFARHLDTLQIPEFQRETTLQWLRRPTICRDKLEMPGLYETVCRSLENPKH